MDFMQFYEEKYSKFSKIFSNIPRNSLFPPNRQKINAWFVKFLEKYAKIMHFSNFLNKNFQHLRKFSQNFQ